MTHLGSPIETTKKISHEGGEVCEDANVELLLLRGAFLAGDEFSQES